VPSTYAWTSTAIGAPRRIICPVVALIDSIVPSAGDASSFLPRPKMPLVRATTWPAFTASPCLTSMIDARSPAGTASCDATATGVTSPSMKVRATTSRALTEAPAFTSTSPGTGRTRLAR